MKGVWLQVNGKIIPYNEMKIQDAEALIQYMDFSEYDKSIKKLMGVKDKYYTPTIEEFHVGFEYELKRLNSWDKDIISIDDLASSYGNPDGIAVKLKEGRVRVKYLDQEDIESLGFGNKKRAALDWYQLEKRIEDNYNSYGYWRNFHLVHGDDKNTVNILAYEYGFNDSPNTLFQGIIKNKSELKRLLKQLGIC